MKLKSNLSKAVGLGVVAAALSAGAAFAATATTPVNVRTGPGTGYAIVDTLYAGEHVNVTGTAGGWCRVTKAGPDGWVSCAYLSGASYGYGGPHAYVRQPSVQFSFGFGSPGPYYPPPHHIYPMHPMHPWWW